MVSMSPSFLFIEILNGLSNASFLFILSSGLTIVFGVTRVLNFAHGSFYMLGAYFAVTLVAPLLDWSYGPASFWAAVLLAAIGTGLLGAAMEVLLLRRVYHSSELSQLLATFGVVLIVEDAVGRIFGAADILGPRAPGLRGAVTIFGERFSSYDLAVIGIGVAVWGLLWLLMNRTRFGTLIRAATQDRVMLGALGVNQALLFTATLFLGSLLAGFAGALQIAKAPANGGMDLAMIVEAFVVTVIGGMGSVTGAAIGAVLIGELQAFGILFLPRITLVLIFLVMAAVLALRPWGLLGRPEGPPPRSAAEEAQVMPWRRGHWLTAGLVVLLLALAPLVADTYFLNLCGEVILFALFACSLNLLVGGGGLVSFSHAAFFGTGAYAAALLVAKLGSRMEPALLAAPIAAAVLAAGFGLVVARLSGIYLAMLTLAVAQIVFAVAFQWVELTGGENGLVGIWPAGWVKGPVPYYYLILALAGGAILLLRRAVDAPFGYSLRGARDAEKRADAIGIDVIRHRFLAFVLAGAAAGLAGGLYVFSKGTIDPAALSIPISVDGLVMVVLGGIQSATGPIVGAVFFQFLRDFLIRFTDLWRLVLGCAIIAVVLLSPDGLVGLWGRGIGRLRRRA
mgnify:CR=1 FL=1